MIYDVVVYMDNMPTDHLKIEDYKDDRIICSAI